MTLNPKHLVGVAMMALALPVFAAQLTPEQALARLNTVPATRLLSVGSKSSVADLKLVYTGRAADMSTFYVFNAPEKGYYILAADDLVSNPVLGFSDNGVFDSENMPSNMRYWLEEYSRQIEYMAANPGGKSPQSVPLFAEASRHNVAPICKVKWDQSTPYNNLCPMENNQRTLTGCVATAMAQVMKAHNWPKKGQGSNSYTPVDPFNNVTLPTVTVDFSKSEYDWDNMLNVYDGNATEVQQTAVAKLMFDCGVSVDMAYSPVASGASSTAIAEALVKYFNYDKGIQQLWRSYYGIDEWVDIMYKEMAAGRPVLCGGSNAEGGHAFVIDGYRTEGNYFHLNWGWSGMSNGYFLLTALDPDMQGNGGSSSGYNVQQIATIGIQPPVEGSNIIPSMGANTDFCTGAATYSRSSSTLVQFFAGEPYYGVFNYTPATITPRLGVKLVSEDSEPIYLDYGLDVSMTPSQGVSKYTVSANKFPDSGTYTVTPAFKYNGEWYDVMTQINQIGALKLTASASTLKFEQIPVKAKVVCEDLKVTSAGLYVGRPFQAEYTLRAEGGEYYEAVYLALHTAFALKSTLTLTQVDIPEGETRTFKVTTDVPTEVAAGTYKMSLIYAKKGKAYYISDPLTVTVNPEPSAGYKVESLYFGDNPSETGGWASSPAEVSLDNMVVNMSIKSSGGLFLDNIVGVIFSTNNGAIGTQVAALPGAYIEVPANETKTVTLSGNLTGMLQPDVVYALAPFGQYGAGQMVSRARYFKGTASAGIEDVTDCLDQLMVFVDANVAQFDAPVAIRTVELFNMAGMLVARGEYSDTQADLSLDGVAGGVLIARVTMADGTVATRRIIKR